MSIVNSVIAKNIDIGYGRYIEELHTDSAGKTHIVRYQCEHGFDVNARMSQRVSELTVQLAETEANEVLNGG